MHIRYFTEGSIKNIFGRYGLKVTSITTTGSFGTDIYTILKWFLKKAHIRKLQNSTIFKIAIKAIKILFHPIDIVLNVLTIHSEQIVVMRKENG